MMDAAVTNDRPICIAITAMGGQGGGVLADWIVAMAEAEGWVAQSTSVPGVAQRTGATIYYVEIIRAAAGRSPVLALMPVPGAVDVVIAAELMEAGRAIQRGLVSERTVLIASAHRSLSMMEKIRPGDGTADPTPVLAAATTVARRFLAADMQALAERNGSVISAALFGALAGSGALPFARPAFEAAITAAGVGVKGSLAAFAAGFEAVTIPPTPAPQTAPAPALTAAGPPRERAALDAVLARLAAYPPAMHDMLRHGIRRVADYQDAAYADAYLDRVARLLELDGAEHGWRLGIEAARWIAVAMTYDDPIRVADLKTRPARGARVRDEVGVRADQLLETTEFLHPRVAEIVGTMPAGLGRFFERSALLCGLLRLGFERGRRVRTSSLPGFFQLWAVASLRPWRRSLLRHQREMAHVSAWLDLVGRLGATDYALGVELLICRRLVKGYSDTHTRGQSKFDRVTDAATRLAGRADAADWVRRLREAALADAEGKMLDGALATVGTL